MADTYGRKQLYSLSMGIYLILVLAIYFVSSANAMISINFLIGALTTVRISICYIYMCELVPAKYQAICAIAWNFFDVGIYLTITLYFSFLSNNWLPISLLGVIQAAWSFYVAVRVPESPKFLIN